MRAELRRIAGDDPRLRAFDREFRSLLASWFDIGFLELRTITWSAPAALLEKLASYEAVHPVRGWVDIKHRLAAPNRRCYAFVHPQMPDEPLIFVWVALTRGMADNVQDLLRVHGDPDEGNDADSAVFYSISTTQKGLSGVSFGDFLIKRVVDDLAGTTTRIRNYATLSPVPGFRTWVEEALAESRGGTLDARSKALLADVATAAGADDPIETLFDRPARLRDGNSARDLREPLLRLAAWYLTGVKNGIHARDRVANFHLSNGAAMERLNWMADTSRKGIAQSAGMMINYRYRIADIDSNHEHYRGEGRIAMSGAIRALLKGPP
jgi:malonyl-CoA decarboxylase